MPPRYLRRIMRVVLAVALTVSPALLSAHGALKTSSPVRDARLSQLPSSLQLTFTERVELSIARVLLVRDGRDTLRLGSLQSDSSGRVLSAAVLDAGTLIETGSGHYVIHWLITGKDGHPVRGTIPFSVASGMRPGSMTGDSGALTDPHRAATRDSAAPGTTSNAPNAASGQAATPGAEQTGDTNPGGVFATDGVLPTLTRWLAFVAYFLLVGSVTALIAVVPSLERQGRGSFAQALKSRCISMGVAAGVMLLIVDIGRLVLQHHVFGAAGSPVSYAAILGSTTWGTAWLVRNQAVVGALLALLLARRVRGAWYRASIGIAALALVGITAGMSLSGHAASVEPRTPAIVYDMVHALSAATWIGTLAMLLLVVVPLLRSDAATAIIAVRSFSRVAMGAVALLMITGLLSASNHVGGWSVVLNSAYGRVLLIKLAIIAIVIALGARNQLRLRNDRMAASDRITSISRSGRAELLAAVIVLLVTATLVATPTPPTETTEGRALLTEPPGTTRGQKTATG